MTDEERCDNFHKLCFTIVRHINSLNEDAEVCGSLHNNGNMEFTSRDHQVLYRITMDTNDKLEEWKQAFNGDITRDRLEEHLSFTDVIKNYKYIPQRDPNNWTWRKNVKKAKLSLHK
jgi:hypothetical protein